MLSGFFTIYQQGCAQPSTNRGLSAKGSIMAARTESVDVDEVKKKIETEMKSLAKKTKPILEETKALREKKDEAEKQKDKKQVVDLQKELKKLEAKYLSEAESVEDRLQKAIKDFKPPKEDERGFAKWYADIVDKESGIDLGKDVKLWGSFDSKKGEVKLTLDGKF
jgi:exonuclease VII large subunit